MSWFIVIIIAVVLVWSLIENHLTDNDFSAESNNSTYNYITKGGVNNPGYLVYTNTSWLGKVDSADCVPKFENFSTIIYGIRAWYVNLFGKYQKGIITNTSQMIDVLTPAGKENPEAARQNYKASVSQAQSWAALGKAVFNFEANPSWTTLSSSEQIAAINEGLRLAVDYKYKGQTPQYFQS